MGVDDHLEIKLPLFIGRPSNDSLSQLRSVQTSLRRFPRLILRASLGRSPTRKPNSRRPSLENVQSLKLGIGPCPICRLKGMTGVNPKIRTDPTWSEKNWTRYSNSDSPTGMLSRIMVCVSHTPRYSGDICLHGRYMQDTLMMIVFCPAIITTAHPPTFVYSTSWAFPRPT